MKKIYFFTCLLFVAFTAKSQWVADTNTCNVICNVTGTQYQPRLCPDGHAKELLCAGQTEESANPEFLPSTLTAQATFTGRKTAFSDTIPTIGAIDPEIVTDSAGGAIIVYETYSTADHIFAVRIDSMGNSVWAAPVPIDVIHDARGPALSSDEHGGAVINWYAYVSPGSVQILVQWIDSTGFLHLPANGLQVTNNTNAHCNQLG